MNPLKLLRFFSLFTKKENRAGAYKVLSLSTLMVVIATFFTSSPIDIFFVLVIESIIISFVITFGFLIVFRMDQVFMSQINWILCLTIPMVMFHFIEEILGFELLLNSPFPLLHYGVEMHDEDLGAIFKIIDYFGTDLYVIIASVLVFHVFFDLREFYFLSKELENVEEDTWTEVLFGNFSSKAIMNLVFVQMFVLITTPIAAFIYYVVPFSIPMWIFTTAIVIFRILVEMAQVRMNSYSKLERLKAEQEDIIIKGKKK